jgi:hypothetical protein
MKFSNSAKAKGRLSMLAFSIDRGMRVKYRQIFYKNGDPVMHEGKYVFKEMPTQGSAYTKNLDEIFELIFKRKPEGGELEQFKSFYGALQLLKNSNPDHKIIQMMVDIMIEESLWGRGAQPLGLSGREEDFKIKAAMINEIAKFFPFVKNSIKKNMDLIDKYYETTKLKRES